MRFASFMTLLLFLLTAGRGQAGELRGVLQDSLSGQGIADAQLICLGTLSGERRLTRSGPDGAFSFADLPAGSYWLAATHSAYFSKRLENVAVPGTGRVEHTLLMVVKPLGVDDALPLASEEMALLDEPEPQELSRPDSRTSSRETARNPVKRDMNSIKLWLFGRFMELVGGVEGE
ncbi:MAG: carboxypeptidase regulatory-like domain-containing protein [Calditrichaeota bacterium]|nr:carboxypeptidase regulatory-like domain-containing protein [Calditrichota bacterium]